MVEKAKSGHPARKPPVGIQSMIPFDMLQLLSCPVTHQPLREATRDELKAFDQVLAEGLIREDGQVIYPVRNGIPLLLPGEAIPITREP